MRTYAEVIGDIKLEWRNVYEGATHYMDALSTVDTTDPEAKCGNYTASEVAGFLLRNMGRFIGKRADTLKQELEDLILL